MRARRGWLSALGSQESISAKAWLLVTPVGVVAAPLAAIPEEVEPSRVLLWLALGVVAQIPVGLVFLAARPVITRVRWPRAAVILTTLLAGAVRGLTIALLGSVPDVGERVLASAITMSIWLLLIGAVLESRQRYRREVATLLDLIVARELHGRLLDNEVRNAARAASAHRVAHTSEELRTIVEGAADDHAQTAALLQAAIETKLRPLSHELWFSPKPIPPVAHPRWDAVERVLTADVPVAALTGAAVLLLAWGSVVLHDTWEGALVGIAVALGYGGVLTVARALRRSPWIGSAVRYIGSALIPAVIGGEVIALLGLAHMSSTVAVALGLPVITLCVATAVTLGADRAEIIADLRARLAAPEWDRHLGDLVRHEVDADTATMLHNSIQPALTAAALQLQLAAALDDPARARAALERAGRALADVDRRGGDLGGSRERLGVVAEAWSGITDVTIDLGDLELKSGEWDLLADAVDELVANAVRHGHATMIDVRVFADEECVTIEFTDDGQGMTRAPVPGLGRTWLDTVVITTDAWMDDHGRHVRILRLPRAVMGTPPAQGVSPAQG